MPFPIRNPMIAILILLGCLTRAYADPPSTQPAGPADAFKIFVGDIRQGNSADLPRLCQADAADAQSLLHDFQDIATAIARLHDAVSKKFGPSQVDSVMPDMPTQDDLDGITQTLNGNHAELHGSSIGNLPMINSGDHWKMDLDAMRHGPDFPDNPKYFADFARTISRTADDITAGKLDTPQAANEALEARQKSIADAPTTQP